MEDTVVFTLERYDCIVPIFTSHKTSIYCFFVFTISVINSFFLVGKIHTAQLIKGLVSTCDFQTLYSQLADFTNTIAILASHYGLQVIRRKFLRPNILKRKQLNGAVPVFARNAKIRADVDIRDRLAERSVSL